MITFNVTKASNTQTLYNWERKAFTSDSVLDSKRSGRPQEFQPYIPAVEKSVEKDPKIILINLTY